MSKDDRRRPLREDERELWSVVSKAIKPLKKKPVVKAESSGDTPAAMQPRRKTAPSVVAVAAPKMPPPPPLSQLGRREKSRVRRGHTEIEARLDLHGHTQAQAHGALSRFMHRCVAHDQRLVLVITGKSGVLRQQVPQWLALPELRALLVGYEQAAPNHGGDGALYLRLRRAR